LLPLVLSLALAACDGGLTSAAVDLGAPEDAAGADAPASPDAPADGGPVDAAIDAAAPDARERPDVWLDLASAPLPSGCRRRG
jgi:hypothetical protein